MAPRLIRWITVAMWAAAIALTTFDITAFVIIEIARHSLRAAL